MRATKKVTEMAEEARAHGHDVVIRARPSGGYGVVSIDGVKYSYRAKDGVEALRTLTGNPMGAGMREYYDNKEGEKYLRENFLNTAAIVSAYESLTPEIQKMLNVTTMITRRSTSNKAWMPNIKKLAKMSPEGARIYLREVKQSSMGYMDGDSIDKIIRGLQQTTDTETVADVILYLENHRTEMPIDWLDRRNMRALLYDALLVWDPDFTQFAEVFREEFIN